MNSARASQSQSLLPLNGRPARLGHVVRWQAEPVQTEQAQPVSASSPREFRPALPVTRPL